MRLTRYRLSTHHAGVFFKAAIVADLHDRPYEKILPILRDEKPDLILIPGDLTERLDLPPDLPEGKDTRRTPPPKRTRPGLSLLKACAAIAPTYYSFGNHEIGACHGTIYKAKLAGETIPPFAIHPHWAQIIRESGATPVDHVPLTVVLPPACDPVASGDPESDTATVTMASLGSGLLRTDWIPDLDSLDTFCKTPGFKLLLCHHPEYYDRYLRDTDIDLIISGHAHGGQWRMFGRGIYAPDQPLFPKYTSGVHEGRLVISRGVANSVPLIPRFFNPCEVVVVEIRSTRNVSEGS